MMRILILILALGAGGAAAWLALSMRPSASVTTVEIKPATAPTAEVLVAKTDLTQGQALGPENLRWQVWPDGALNAAFITKSARPDAMTVLTGYVVRGQLLASEPIREDKLASSKSSLLAAMLAPGKRAVAIRISAENSAGGFILPNDRVDVIQTITRPGAGASQGDNLSRTILTNIRVLAVDQKADDPKGFTVVGKTATLELTRAQAETVATGQVTGVLSLALRSVEDNAEAESAGREEKRTGIRIIRAGRSETVAVE